MRDQNLHSHIHARWPFCAFSAKSKNNIKNILNVVAPGIFSDLSRSVQMLKREWGAESNGKLPHLSIPSKTAAWVPEFAVEDLSLSRSAALVPDFAVKDLPLGRILMMMMK